MSTASGAASPAETAPRVSVIIPTYKRPEMLRACLATLTAEKQQIDSSEFEIIVANDGPIDDTLAADTGLPNMHQVQGPARGPGANRNTGVRYATAPVIAFIDDDCYADTGWLPALLGAVVGEVELVEGLTYADREKRRADEESPTNLVGGGYWTCNLAVTARVFEAVGGFDEKFPYPAWEDIDFAVRCKAAGAIPQFAPKARVCHPLRRAPGWKRWRENKASLIYFLSKHPTERGLASPFHWARSAITTLLVRFPHNAVKFRMRGTRDVFNRAVFETMMAGHFLLRKRPLIGIPDRT